MKTGVATKVIKGGLAACAAALISGCAAMDNPASGPYVGGDARSLSAAKPSHRQYFDQQRGRYYYFDQAAHRYYWEDGSPRD